MQVIAAIMVDYATTALAVGAAGNDGLDHPPLPNAATLLIDTLRSERGDGVQTRIDLHVPVVDAIAWTVLSVLTEVIPNAVRHAPDMPVMVTLDSPEVTVWSPPP